MSNQNHESSGQLADNLRVVAGSPTAEELATVIAVLQAALSEAAAAAWWLQPHQRRMSCETTTLPRAMTASEHASDASTTVRIDTRCASVTRARETTYVGAHSSRWLVRGCARCDPCVVRCDATAKRNHRNVQSIRGAVFRVIGTRFACLQHCCKFDTYSYTRSKRYEYVH